MKKITIMDKYPAVTLTVQKDETTYTNVDEVLEYLKKRIELHPIAAYIGVFDHYAHTSSLEVGEIAEEILDAKNIICCFGKVLPQPEFLAVRPRAIGVAEMKKSFVISFMEAPNPEAHAAMEDWVKGVINK